MSASLVVEELVSRLQERYGRPTSFGKSRLLKFGQTLTCSINYSKLLRGHRYFFGLAQEPVDPVLAYPNTESGEYCLDSLDREGMAW